MRIGPARTGSVPGHFFGAPDATCRPTLARGPPRPHAEAAPAKRAWLRGSSDITSH